MNEFSLYLKQIGDHLEVSGTSWCLIGGLAVGARTDPRFTKDVDLAVSVATDEDSEHSLRLARPRAAHEILDICADLL